MDLDLFDDMTPFADELDDPVAELAQDVYHVLIEPPGSNIDDPTRGVGILSALSGKPDSGLAHRIDAQLQRLDGVDVSRTTIAKGADDVWRIAIEIDFNGQSLGLSFDSDGNAIRRVA